MAGPLLPILVTLTAAAAPAWTVRDVPLCPPDGMLVGLSIDFKHVACLVKLGKQWRVDVDGRPGAPFKTDIMNFSGVHITDDAQRFAYFFKDEGRWHVVVDGVEVAGSKGARWYQTGSISFHFTEGGRRWFLLAGRGADAAGIGGAMGGPIGALVGSLFSKGPAFALVVDGETVAEEVRHVLGSRDGRRFAYVVSAGVPTLVVRESDGTENRHAGVSCEGGSHCAVSPDGTRLAYSVRRNDAWTMVVDGVEGPPYEDVGPPVFSADGKRLAHAAKRAEKWMIVSDGALGPAYDQVGSPATALVSFTRDGARFAYAAQRNGKWVVVLDGAAGDEYEEITSLNFSPDGKRLVYGAKRASQWSMAEAGIAGKAYERVYGPVFSADGTRMAHGARRDGKNLMVIDGREEGAYEDLGTPAFSPGGEHVAYPAKRDGKWRIVVDGADLGEYRLEGQFRTILFDGPGRFYSLARGREKQQMVRLEGELMP